MSGWVRSRILIAALGVLVLMVVQPRVASAQQGDIKIVPSEDNGRAISMDVQNAEIGTVLRSIASYAGVNIVASPRVVGKVTVKLDQVPWREALTVILRAHSFDYVEEHGVLRVDTAEELRQEELEVVRASKQVEEMAKLESGMVTLSFANAEEVKNSLEQMLTSRGKLDVDTRTNTLLISDIPERVAIIQDMSRALDNRTPQVEINARLVDIDLRASQELGITWAANNIKDAGTNIVGSASIDAPIQSPVGNLRIGTVQSYGDLMFNLQALEKKNLAELISNPVITTTDNREASILVGQKIPLIVADEAGNALVQLTTIGIVLRVTPHINSEDRITLDIHNEVSDLSSQATVQGGVIINTSESDTRVLVQDGETAIIAGLIRSVESKLETGVPVLKDVPLLGGLFKQKQNVNNSRELVVFVTPRIVTDDYLKRARLSADSQHIGMTKAGS
jgi:type IV pilus assembly protein PilQ